MPATSKKQRKLFGIARAIQKGEIDLDKQKQSVIILTSKEKQKCHLNI